MDALLFLVPLAVLLGAVFALLFLKAAAAGQFDDLDDEGWRVLDDDETGRPRSKRVSTGGGTT